MEAYVLSNADISKTYYTVKFNTSQEKKHFICLLLYHISIYIQS